MGWIFPENFWYWLVLPPVLYLLWLLYQRSNTILPKYFRISHVNFFNPVLKNGLRAVGFLCLLISLVGFYVGTGASTEPVLGRQIFFLLDVSSSMNVTDVTPSRLAKAKTEILNIAKQLKGEQLGLIVFTNFSYMQCPLTTDFGAFELYLSVVSTELFANTGTDFRNALNQVSQRFENLPPIQDADGNNISNKNIARAVVIISDGEDYGKKNTSTLIRLENQGIEVFCVGVGTDNGGSVPGSKESGELFKHNASGGIANSKRVDEKLQEISRYFGTEYFTLKRQSDNLDRVSDQIKNLPASPIAAQQDKARNNTSGIFLLISLVCICTSMFYLPQIRK